jgi:hypothetical protein
VFGGGAKKSKSNFAEDSKLGGLEFRW